MNEPINVLRELLSSKKALASACVALVAALAPVLSIPSTVVDAVVKIGMVYVSAQGVADFGKSAGQKRITP